MGIREKIVVLAIVLMVLSYLIIYNLTERKPEENGEQANNLAAADWLKNVPGAGDIRIDPSLITYKSDLFRIQAVASMEEMRAAVSAIVQRYQESETGQFKCRILRWMYL